LKEISDRLFTAKRGQAKYQSQRNRKKFSHQAMMKESCYVSDIHLIYPKSYHE